MDSDHPCCKCSRCGTIFFSGITKREREKRVLLSAYGLSFLDVLGQKKKTMAKRDEKKRPTPNASTAGTCLSVVNILNAPIPEVPRHLHQVNSFHVGCW